MANQLISKQDVEIWIDFFTNWYDKGLLKLNILYPNYATIQLDQAQQT